jgi:hypothetical protein
MLNQDEEKQKELFEEFSKPAKKPFFFKGSNRYLQNNVFIWQVSSEKIVFLIIGVIILAVITFCLGVEHGKRLRDSFQPDNNLPRKLSRPISSSSTSRPASSSSTGRVPTDTRSSVKEPVPTAPQKKYTIMVASYIKKDDAQKDAVRLKKAGFPVYITPSGRFFVIKVGDFNDRAQADAALATLKKKYKDVYIKTHE